jgi:hypothetical protein
MKISEMDFYTGFEGEPKLIFTQVLDNREEQLMMWEGYFDTIMDKVDVSSTDEWTGIAYYYHLCLGCWGEEEENWQVPNVEEVLSQLQATEMSIEDSQATDVLKALIVFLKEAVKKITLFFLLKAKYW